MTDDRVFKKKLGNIEINSCMQLLVDCSGSMDFGSQRYEHAAAAATLLSEVCQDLQVPCYIVGYSERHQKLFNYVFKEFDEQVNQQKLISRFNSNQIKLLQNADGESILYNYSKLILRKEPKKIMIVLSDGAPECDRKGNIDEFTLRVIRSIEQQRQVKLFGVGIESDWVEELYSHYCIINHANELERKLLNLMREVLV